MKIFTPPNLFFLVGSHNFMASGCMWDMAIGKIFYHHLCPEIYPQILSQHSLAYLSLHDFYTLSQSVLTDIPCLYTGHILSPMPLPLHPRRIWYGTSSPGKCTYASWLPGSPIFMAGQPTPRNRTLPRNKVLIFGLIKGNQWLVSPDQGAVGWLAMILEAKVESWKTWEGFILGCCPPLAGCQSLPQDYDSS